ncbi:SRPBCC family protein [Paraflavitalea pollutisoli]|uniref:SRPBCC family protein n=1 Tax=Paraflavitalea pollutisoli TaxID=3034143 RepID=UPI0023EB300E|nr:SRPBCC family protein [Paraflavitalea sp. H1-2-19X]
MKKFFKIAGIILLSLIVLVLIAGLMLPKKVALEKSITINATGEQVWQHVNNLEACHKWSPFVEEDPNTVVSYSGQSGTVGSSYAWKSEKVGEGTQTITKLEPGQRVDSHLHFIKPFEGEADTYIKLTPAGNATNVTWGFESEYKYPMNVMGNLMKGSLGDMFQNGLNNLKEQSESN